jgi:hypothetical protein
MIQRIQSLWLFLAAAAIFFLFKLPIVGAKKADGSILEVLATGSLFTFIIAVLLLIIALVTIFLFKNRANQKRLIWLGILLDVLFVVLLYFQMEDLKDVVRNPGLSAQTFKVGAIFPIFYVILLVLAYNGIRHDEKLIKSVDRLR